MVSLDEDLGRENKLVMYSSSGLLEQYFNQYADDISKIIERERKSKTTKLSGKLGSIIASIRGAKKHSSEKEFVHELNFNESHRQVRALMNIFSDSSPVSPVQTLADGENSPTGLYKFDTNLQLIDTEESGENMIRVRGIEGAVDFTGLSSLDNWSSRSFVRTARTSIDPFPFEGVFKPVEKVGSVKRETEEGFVIESLELKVQFLYILAPDADDYIDWTNYRKLVRDHPKDLNDSGIEE